VYRVAQNVWLVIDAITLSTANQLSEFVAQIHYTKLR